MKTSVITGWYAVWRSRCPGYRPLRTRANPEQGLKLPFHFEQLKRRFRYGLVIYGREGFEWDAVRRALWMLAAV
jgi:hypothetical protein